MKTYKRQNKIQKELISFVRIFKNDKRATLSYEQKGFNIYTPKLNKLKVSFGIVGFLVLLILPLIPDFIFLPFITKWCLK